MKTNAERHTFTEKMEHQIGRLPEKLRFESLIIYV
jgi:hypothetical protein